MTFTQPAVGGAGLEQTKRWKQAGVLAALPSRIAAALFHWLDVLVPKNDTLILRTVPEVEDGGLALWSAMDGAMRRKVVWLVDEVEGLSLAAPPYARYLRSRSVAGVWAFLRARCVIHSHGVYGSARTARRKQMINMWHGMPIKRLDAGSAVGRFQTDLSTATSSVHAGNLATTWGLPQSRVPVLGLPRNDRLISPSPGDIQAAADLKRDGVRHLVAWLPTYRHSVMGQLRDDGTDAGNVFQMPGADFEAVAALAETWNAHVLVKTHPMAAAAEAVNSDRLTVWSDGDLEARGLTLYSLLASADLLITDHSSVWVDYLLLDRPMVFTISDLEAYGSSRGYYFSPLPDYLPGRLVQNFDQLGPAIEEAFDDDPLRAHRHKAISLHHEYRDAGSAARLLRAMQSGGPCA